MEAGIRGYTIRSNHVETCVWEHNDSRNETKISSIPLLMERGECYYINIPGPKWIFDFAFV